jgi:hypothetical protein
MARSKFEDLSVVSEMDNFTIRQHVSTKGGEPITTPGGRVIEYPIARISRGNSEGVDVAELVEALDNAFKNHWENNLDAPDHIEFPSLAYRICIGLNHAHSLEHDGRWPSGVPSYRFESFKKDLIEAIGNADNATTDSEVLRLKDDYPEYFSRWQAETAAAQAALASL